MAPKYSTWILSTVFCWLELWYVWGYAGAFKLFDCLLWYVWGYAGAFRLFDCLLVITLLVVLENAFAWVATNLFSLAFCFFLLDWLALGRTSRAWSASCFTPWNTRCCCYPVSWFLPTTCTNHTSYNSQGNYTSLVCTPLKSSYFCPVDFPMLKLERYQLHMLSALPIVHWLKKM